VDVSEEIRDALARLRRTGHGRGDTATEALRPLDDERIMILARYEGQSLSELEVSLQLLPVGTRMYLQTVGALTLHDDGDTYFRVEVHEFALDMVAAAVELQAQRRRRESGSVFEEAVARTLTERFALETDNAAVPQDLAGAVDVLGTFEAKGRLSAAVDERTRIGEITVLDDAGMQIRNARVHYRFEGHQSVAIGATFKLNFLVGLPKHGYLPFRHGRRGTEKVSEIVTSKPGVIRVKYDKLPAAGLVSFMKDKDPEPNAVAELLKAQPESHP
jgi:hypothetical protein